MKKFGIYFLIIMFLFITGCRTNKTKEIITLDNFNSIATDNDFMVVDSSDEYVKATYIVGSRKATLGNIEVEMLEYIDNKSAEIVHDEHIDSFNLLKTTGAHEVNDEGKNYYRYELVSNGYYMISTRVDNTLIFCKTLLDNKETVEELFDELGY